MTPVGRHRNWDRQTIHNASDRRVPIEVVVRAGTQLALGLGPVGPPQGPLLSEDLPDLAHG